jgi:hypothetical protein
MSGGGGSPAGERLWPRWKQARSGPNAPSDWSHRHWGRQRVSMRVEAGDIRSLASVPIVASGARTPQQKRRPG